MRTVPVDVANITILGHSRRQKLSFEASRSVEAASGPISKSSASPAIEHRTAVDLKDKWRNLLRIAMLPQQSVKTVSDKKREIPQELLAKVRELAAKQAKAKAAAESRR